MKLNLCCGQNIKKGWVNVDYIDFGQEIIADLNKKWEFKNNSIDEILCESGVEHLDSVKHFFKEAVRILKPNGTCSFRVDHFKAPCAYKLTHNHYFSWQYFAVLPEPHDFINGFKIIKNELIIENRFFPFTLLNKIANINPRQWEKLFYVCALKVTFQKNNAKGEKK